MLWDCLDGLSAPDLSLIPGICLENCPFNPDFPVLMSIWLLEQDLMIFLNFQVSVDISPFSFLILLIWILSLCPLVSLAKDLSILLIFSNNQLLPGLVDFVCVCVCVCSSFCFYLVDFSPEFDYFLLSTPLGCICFFLL